MSSERYNRALNWWLTLLRVSEFMPNRNRIQIRGPTYSFYHKNVYAPQAKRCGLYLAYKGWKNALPAALREYEKELEGAEVACGRRTPESARGDGAVCSEHCVGILTAGSRGGQRGTAEDSQVRLLSRAGRTTEIRLHSTSRRGGSRWLAVQPRGRA